MIENNPMLWPYIVEALHHEMVWKTNEKEWKKARQNSAAAFGCTKVKRCVSWSLWC